MKKLLINFVYYPPVGHLLEVIKHSHGYYEANKDLEISLLVNSETPIELAQSCSWIKKVYPISVEEVSLLDEASCLQSIPKDWDYVLTDPRVKNPKPESETDHLANCQLILQKVFVGKEITDITPKRSGRENDDVSLTQLIPYKLNSHIELPIPKESEKYVKKYLHNGPVITILPSGSAGYRQSPSLQIWEEICLALSEAIPNLKINFTGVTKSQNGRTVTEGIKLEDIDNLVSKLSKAENCFNIGLWNQIALIKASNILCSPHTGFSFISQVVGTPWLTISGCPWPEYFFNDTKFYSVLPDCGSYPSKGNETEGCGKLLAQGKKSVCMQDESLRKKIPKIIEGAKMLLDKTFNYDKSINLHLKNIERFGKEKFFFFDGIMGVKAHKDDIF